jgi:hypothetical protein
MNFLKSLWRKFSGLKTWQKFVTIVLILALFGAISGSGNSGKTSDSDSQAQIESEVPVEETTLDILSKSSVNWDNYSPAVKSLIAELIDAQDCEGLQTQFDNADANNTAQLNRTGESNAELMSLLDGEMRDIGCY